jgi:NADPH2:quinone reductase
MPHAIRIVQHGPPEAMQWVEVPPPVPGKGEALLRQTAVGVNFIDVYHRNGVYPLTLPAVPGSEGAGIVEAVGPGVTEVKVGDRVAYQGLLGGYAEVRVAPAARLVPIPREIDDRTAAAALLKGVTAYYLLFRTFKVQRGHTVLFHAAAGGIGSLACQWASALGATVIGTVGADEKIPVARGNGCAHVINYRREDFVARTRALTSGEGVEVAYDSVGKDTFPGSLDCLKPLGMWVSFGQSSGVPPPFTAADLQRRGSLFATRPTTTHYFAKRPDLLQAAEATFTAIAKGTIKVAIGAEFPLKEAAAAHRALESRQTVGSIILVP